MQIDPQLIHSMQAVPAGRWGIAVSGGADSVALLRLACDQPHLQPHVIHLDHQTREGESAADAAFVLSLANELHVPVHLAQRSQIEDNRPPSNGTPGEGRGEGLSAHEELFDVRRTPHPNPLPEYRARGQEKNLSARYRAARLRWFGIVAERFNLAGILLAHHADDQAETIAQRLLRGRQPAGLRGMSTDATVDGVRLLRPLLGVPRDALRTFLTQINQPWVEDASNTAPTYQRNRVRQSLAKSPELVNALLSLGDAAGLLADWLDRTAPELPESFDVQALSSLPQPLARHAAAGWLRGKNCPAADISPSVCDRLIALAANSAGPARIDFPGKLAVRRSRGRIFALSLGTKGSQHIQPMGVIHNVGSMTLPSDRSKEKT